MKMVLNSKGFREQRLGVRTDLVKLDLDSKITSKKEIGYHHKDFVVHLLEQIVFKTVEETKFIHKDNISNPRCLPLILRVINITIQMVSLSTKNTFYQYNNNL